MYSSGTLCHSQLYSVVRSQSIFYPRIPPEHLEQMNAGDGDKDEAGLGFLTDGPVGVAEG